MAPASESAPRPRLPHSCAECRRLKLKCDRDKPCSSCVRRGCPSICPAGTMTAKGKGSRFVLANTEELHDKIEALIARVRQLEDALETSHTLNSHEPHTLLRDELRRIATPLESARMKTELLSKEDELAENIGTLTLDGHGHGSRYFGSTGTLSYLWRDGGPGPDIKYKMETSVALAELPSEVAHLANAFPICLRMSDTAHLSTWILENCLPPSTEAWSLFENYWEHYTWHSMPFTRSTFIEQIFSPLYHRSPDIGDKPLGHRLALLFMVFAIGEFMDFTQPLGPSSGLRYFLLARASLGLDRVLESPTVTALQAMYLMAVFLMMSGGAWEPEHAWILSGMNTKLALTLGLQHDASKFDLPDIEVEARRQVLIPVLWYETWQALNLGRSPSYTFNNFDWVLPKEPDTTQDFILVSGQWPAFFVRDCVSRVVELSVGSKETSYSAVLALGSRIREYPEPSIPTSDPSEEPQSIAYTMRGMLTSVLKELTLLYLHRRFFARALRDSPDDPLQSLFATSVFTCHRSAITFLKLVREIYVTTPEMISRVWFIWPNLFVATLIVGSITARSPGCSLAASALQELEMICRFWETIPESLRGSKVLGTVRTLEHKASMAFAHNNGPKDHFRVPSKGLDVSDEIIALGGPGPRVISSSSSQPSSSSPSSLPGSSPYSHEQEGTSIPRQASPFSGPPAIHFSSNAPTEPTPATQSSFTGVVPDSTLSSTGLPFEFTSPNFSSQNPEYTTDALPINFDEVFQSMPSTATTQAPAFVPTVLGDLGLGRGWQSVMDELGL